jgi:hypothetical protein
MPRGAFLGATRYSSGATGGIAGEAGAGAVAFGARVASGCFACNGSTVPAASCGAAGGRLRGTGGFAGVIAADFITGFGVTCCGNGIG